MSNVKFSAKGGSASGGQITKSVAVLIVVAANIFPPLASFTTKAAAAYDSGVTQTYLAAHQTGPWVTMALAAMGAQNIQTDYLKSISSNKAIDYEAPILALTALGKNPRTFGGTDYIAKLESFDADGQLGDISTVNDDIFGLLALASAGRSSSAAAVNAKTYILSHQNSDGGWGFAASAGSDSNTTAAAITALLASNTDVSDSHIQSAFAYLKTAQNSDGGFTYDPKSQYGTDSDSSSTAWVLWALKAANISPADWAKDGHSPADYLAGNQDAGGWFKFQPASTEDSFSAVTTAYAAIALTGKTLPIGTVTDSGSSGSNGQTGGNTGISNTNNSGTETSGQYNYRIQGSAGEICSGKMFAAKALDIVKNASLVCGFDYHISNTSYGPYLDQIGSDAAAGTKGWMYLVNFISPNSGAADYALKDGDSVLWFYGDFSWKPLKLTLSATQISSGQASVAHVESYSGTSWSPVSGATVYYGASQGQTNASGDLQISPADGYYKISAHKDGFVNSNGMLLQVGQPGGSSVTLTANLELGLVAGTSTPTIAFTVNPNAIDFGTVLAGQTASKNITVANTGTTGIEIQAIVNGDQFFKNGLSLDGNLWPSFDVSLASSGSKISAAKLTIPSGAKGSSHQANGSIIFWATAH